MNTSKIYESIDGGKTVYARDFGAPPNIRVLVKSPEKKVEMIYVPASVGELVDKITILKIKLNQIKDAAKLVNIQREHDALTFLSEYVTIQKVVLEHQQQLMNVNLAIWFLEEDIRYYEKIQHFGADFIDVARKIYKTNDERSRIKKEINILCNSELVEEKSHEE